MWLGLLLAGEGGNVSLTGDVKSDGFVAVSEAFGDRDRSVPGDGDALESISDFGKWLLPHCCNLALLMLILLLAKIHEVLS